MTIDVDEVLLEATERMEKAVTHAQSEFASVRTGRASPAFIEKLSVEYYGTDVPLQQLAGFSVPEARVLVVSPYDKGAMGAIEKAIRNSDLGLAPSNDGVVIRLNFPPLTQERRRDFVKLVKGQAEDGKVAVRNVRRDVRKSLEAAVRAGDLSTDEVDRAEKELDKLTHDHVEEIDRALAAKEKELLED